MKTGLAGVLFLSLAFLCPSLNAATSITQYGITWTFDKDCQSGQFCTGDYWIVGPVRVIGITTNLHAPGFTPKPGEDGSMVNPSQNMPQYGRDMGQTMIDASLLLHIDFSRLPGHPTKDKLLIALVQYGIDLAGIADNGGGWPNNGGHDMGRKWPILFAGVMLGDPHMKDVGNWKTRFQEDEQTFYVTQAEVDLTHGLQWTPDKRSQATPYENEDIGMPEWGITHADKPACDNRTWDTVYRDINYSVNAGYVLAARIMDQEAAWNHKALFDYTDRVMKETGGKGSYATNSVHPFVINMWKMCD